MQIWCALELWWPASYLPPNPPLLLFMPARHVCPTNSFDQRWPPAGCRHASCQAPGCARQCGKLLLGRSHRRLAVAAAGAAAGRLLLRRGRAGVAPGAAQPPQIQVGGRGSSSGSSGSSGSCCSGRSGLRRVPAAPCTPLAAPLFTSLPPQHACFRCCPVKPATWHHLHHVAIAAWHPLSFPSSCPLSHAAPCS